jgi:hypothetical protein
MVDELSAIVGIETEQGKGQAGAGISNRVADCVLAAIHERDALGPLGRDVGEHEAMQIFAIAALPAVGDQIDFEETGAVVIPVGEGTKGDLLSEERAGFGRCPTARQGGMAGRDKQAIRRRRAER